MTRDEALALLHEHTPSESLRRHCLTVEVVMRHKARVFGEDVEQWGLAGLLHDFDYELHPEEHPKWGMALLDSMGVDPAVIRAIGAHYPSFTGIEPSTPMERWLFAVDELSGLITACAYVRPSKSVLDVEVKSVLKKFKTPNFAAGVNREDVAYGASLVGLTVEELIAEVLTPMQDRAAEIGLLGG